MCAVATPIQPVLETCTRIFQEILEEKEIGIKVNGVWANNILYADNTILIAGNIDDLQHLVNMVGQHSKSMSLNINSKKTKFKVVSRDLNAIQQLQNNIWCQTHRKG